VTEPLDLDELRRTHVPKDLCGCRECQKEGDANKICVTCTVPWEGTHLRRHESWPCLTRQLLDEIEGLREALKASPCTCKTSEENIHVLAKACMRCRVLRAEYVPVRHREGRDG
jgi:hypothetical protein